MKDSSRFQVTGYRIVLVVLLSLAMTECGSDVDITFNLINPCRTDVLGDEGCQFIRLVVSSLNPQDELHPDNTPGPLAAQCSIEKGNCSLGGSDLLGFGRIVDVQCYVDQNLPPVARATSGALEVEDGQGGTFNLLLGTINGFVETTILKGSDVGQCSTLAEYGRYGHTATRLHDGRVLIVGGIRRIGGGTVGEILATAVIYDPWTGTHRQVVGSGGRPLPMNAGRAFHTATLLSDGNVLITGGVGLVQNKWESLRSSEIFHVDSETFPPGLGWIGVLKEGRSDHTATMLTASRKVLVIGGTSYADGNLQYYHDTAEVYDPATNEWIAVTNTMSSKRAYHTATELDPINDGGKVLVTGGVNSAGTLKTVEIYNPGANQFYSEPDPQMAVNRAHHCAVRLQNGEVLVAGGTTTVDVDVDAGVEIYTSEGGHHGGFKEQTLNLNHARMDHTCTLLEGTGDVLVAGGLTGSGQATSSGEVVVVEDFYKVNDLTDVIDPPRYLHTATALENGWVYLAGGLASQAPDAQPIVQSLLFVPETPYYR
jgi:hypothetical protein